MAKNRNFDRNPSRGCNYSLEGGAVLDLRGCNHGFRGCITLLVGTAINRRGVARPCGQNPGQGTVRSVLIFVCIRSSSSREETA